MNLKTVLSVSMIVSLLAAGAFTTSGCSLFGPPEVSPSMSRQATPDDTAASFAAAASANEKASMLALMTPKAKSAQQGDDSWVKLFSDPRAKVISTSADPAEIDGDQAKVHCRVRYVKPGETNEREDRLRFRMKKNNGVWWIHELE
ncbi:MAG: hypothetical protein U0165_04550 [Polyangiaceae bacterium]